jgi:aminoglycoside 3-N-acetyltransferase
MPAGKAAVWLIEVLTSALGDCGTLTMPTHPLYKENPGFMVDKSDLVLTYSPQKTPSSVGLLSEFFRRAPGTLRSRHPLSSLAARGPLAEELLADNLNDREPLPHGAESGYYRFCQRGGLVVGLGVQLIKPLTILHVAEEVRDRDWPVCDFFYTRRFEIDDGGEKRLVTVRERRPEFVRGLALGQCRRDFLGHGILNEGCLGGMQVETVRSRQLLEWMQARQRGSTYPYYWTTLSRLGRPPKA